LFRCGCLTDRNGTAPRVSRGKKAKAGAEAAAAAAGADEAEVEAAGVTAAAQAAAARKLAKKKKKIRYPKNYNPDNPGTPDPERWLPRRCVSMDKPIQFSTRRPIRLPRARTSNVVRVRDDLQ
jgi:hypothetical protein